MPTSDVTTSAVRYAQIKPGYRVGTDGSVWSQVYSAGVGKRRFGEWRLLKPTPQYRGHLMVCIGRRNRRLVHRLVLEAFVGPCPPGMECRHFPDRDPSNNQLVNLQWGTPAENYADSVVHGTASYFGGKPCRDGRPVGSGRLTPEQVNEIKATVPKCKSRSWRKAEIVASLAVKFGISKEYVRMIARGIRCQKVI